MIETKKFALILRQMADDIENNFENTTIEPTKIEMWKHLGLLYMRVPISWDGEVQRMKVYKFEEKDDCASQSPQVELIIDQSLGIETEKSLNKKIAEKKESDLDELYFVEE
jgi:hypothetical protein